MNQRYVFTLLASLGNLLSLCGRDSMRYIYFKGTLSVTETDPPCKDVNARLKPLSDQK